MIQYKYAQPYQAKPLDQIETVTKFDASSDIEFLNKTPTKPIQRATPLKSPENILQSSEDNLFG